MPILRGGLFKRRNRKWLGFGKAKQQQNIKPDNLTLSTITEIEDDDEYSTTTQNNNDRLPRCISLLSSEDADDHLEGLRQLLEIVRDKSLANHASLSLIYGEDDEGTSLQLAFLPFISNDEEERIEVDDDGVAAAGDDDDDDDDDDDWRSLYLSESSEFLRESYNEDNSFLRGLESGKHHDTALLILLYALRTSSKLSDSEARSINFVSPFWQRLTETLVDNMESNYTEGTTTMTLSCFRLLHTLEPTVVKPFLSQLLLPYLSHLRDYGSRKGLPIIRREASRLLSCTSSSSLSPQ